MRPSKSVQWIALSIVIYLSANVVGDTLGPRCSFGPRVAELKPEPNMNATGQMLYGSSFEGLDLSKASFDRCNLRGVRFVQCNLKNASFVRANLTGAVIIECDVTEADFTDAVIDGIKGGLQRPALDAQQLKSTWSFRSKDLSNCFVSAYCDSPGKPTRSSFDFRGFKLNGATFYGTDLTTSKFEDAHIDDVRFERVIIKFEQIKSSATFKSGYLRNVKFLASKVNGDQDFSNLNLAGADITVASSTKLNGATLRDTRISGATFRQIKETASYEDGLLVGCTFSKCDLTDGDFQGFNLTGCVFARCKYSGLLLQDAVISGASFIGPLEELTRKQIDTTWNAKRKGRNRQIPGLGRLGWPKRRHSATNTFEWYE